jgi:hypothetical protein
MNRRHQAVLDADRRMQRLDEGRKAIGRARRVRYDRERLSEQSVVDTVDDRRIHILAARRGNHHLARARCKMGRSLFLAREEARAFEHDIDGERAPRQFRRIAHRQHLDTVAVDDQRIAVHVDRADKRTVHGVEAGQMRVDPRIAEIVDRDNADFVRPLRFVQRTQDVAADAAITVDRHVDGHVDSFIVSTCRIAQCGDTT